MNAEDFLRRVEQTGMVSAPLLEELQKRVSDTHRNMRPEILAKLLVDRGELTPAQARKLIADAMGGGAPPPPPAPPSQTTHDLTLAPEPEEELTFASDPEEELTLAPEEDELDFGSDILGEDILTEESLGPPPTADLVLQGKQEHEEDDDEEELVLLAEDDTAEAILIDEPEDQPEPAPAKAKDTPPPPPPPAPPAPPSNLGEPDPVLDDILGAEPAPEIEGSRLGPRRRGLAALFGDLFPRSSKPKKNRWDSPLILLGGGALILLVAAGVGFFALFYSETADEIFNAGMDAYSSQSYGLAIKNFERFAEKFPNHEKASLARVRVGMAELRQLTDGRTSDWQPALDQANASLPAIKSESAFGQVRTELAKLLPDITAGLVQQARTSGGRPEEKQHLLDQASNALQLVTNPEYLPTSVRQPQEIRIEEIVSNIQIVQRDIDRARSLTTAIQQINTATEAGNIAQAYSLRDELITAYPLLSDDTALRNALSSVTAKERGAVQISEGSAKALSSDHAPTARLSIVLSDERGEPIGEADDRIIAILARGAIYGLRALDGSVLWRRHVGYEADVFPQPIDPDGDLLIVDARRGELQRISANEGELQWRLPCPVPIRAPQIYGNRAFVPCGEGADAVLRAVDVGTGDVANEARFPVGCSAPAAVVESRREVVQVGTHSSLYVLDATSLTCKHVIATGHARGSVTVRPAFVGNSLVVVENSGNDSSRAHVFAVGSDDKWISTMEPIELGGEVATPLSVDDRRVVIASELGELRVLEAPIDGTALREVAAIPGSGNNVGRSYSLLDRSKLWVANQTLARYELQAIRGQLVAQWARARNDRFLNPILRRGSYLFHVRQRDGLMGVTVSAIRADGQNDTGDPIWETDLAVPSSITVSSGGTVHAVTMNGAMFPINAAAADAGVTNVRSARIDPLLVPRAFAQELPIAVDQTIFAGPPPSSHATRANLSTGRLERIPLRLDDAVTTDLVNLDGALLAATDAGPIYLLDASSGAQIGTPFMPRLQPGEKLDWLPPAPVGDNQFIAAESSGRLYHVSVANEGMSLLNSSKVERKLIGGLVAVEKTAYAAWQSGGLDQIARISVPDLALGSTTPLGGGLAWGPKRIHNFVFAADGEKFVYAFGRQGFIWKTDRPVGPLAGAPLVVDDNVLIAATSGLVSIVDQAGRVVSSTQLDEPLGSGPVAHKGNLLVSGWDGTIFLLDMPQAKP